MLRIGVEGPLIPHRDRLDEWSATIRSGETPDFSSNLN